MCVVIGRVFGVPLSNAAGIEGPAGNAVPGAVKCSQTSEAQSHNVVEAPTHDCIAAASSGKGMHALGRPATAG